MPKLVRLLAFAVTALAFAPDPASANCNLIPAAPKEFRSTLGTVDRTIAAPGVRVAVRVDLACHPTAQGFDPVAANNRVFVRFVPPGSDGNPALVTELEVPAADLTPANCGISGRCDTMLFPFPDAALDAALPPDGDGRGPTGPVEIRIEDLADHTVAEIGPLFDPTLACADQQPESVFGHLTAIPHPNSFGALASAADTTLEATIDGHGNLLIPVDYSSELANPGSAEFRILEASADLDAFSNQPGVPIQIPASRYLRSFNLTGRPIPPVLETNGGGDVILGTVDAQLSIVRIARSDPDAPSPPLYDLSDRLFQGRGPIVIANASANARESAPLATLSADPIGITFARNEASTVEPDLNADGDEFDRVPQVIDVNSGVGTSTGLAVTEVSLPAFRRPILASGDGIVAFGASEARQGYATLNADTDVMDSAFRAFAVNGDALATGNATIAPEPVVNGKPLAVSSGRVFFRSHEADSAPRATTLLTPTVIEPFQARGWSNTPSVSRDGRFVAFSSAGGRTFTAVAPPDGTEHVYVFDRANGTYELIDRTPLGVVGNQVGVTPSISGDGRWVAFASGATNLPGADADGSFLDIFLYDRNTQTTICATCDVPGGFEGINPDLSANGEVVAYSWADTIWTYDRVNDVAIALFSEVPTSEPGFVEWHAEGVNPSISGDGRYVVERVSLRQIQPPNTVLTDQVMRFDRIGQSVNFLGFGDLPQISADGLSTVFQTDAGLVTDDVNGAVDAYVWSSVPGLEQYEQISISTSGQQGAGGISVRNSTISDDGRYVAYINDSGHEVPGAPSNRRAFRYDRSTNVIEAVSVADDGAFANGFTNDVAISGDGQTVAFAGFGTNLAPDAFDDVQNVFVRDTGAGASLNAADADSTDTVLQVYDAAANTYRAAARVPAQVVAVAGGRAAILSSEADDGGVTRNGDADATDTVARIVDGATGAVFETGLAASAVAISESIACIAVDEEMQGGTDLDGDGNANDSVLAVVDLATDQVTQTNVTVFPLGLSAAGSHCVFLTVEGSGQTDDLNDDGDDSDTVLRTYDAATSTPSNTHMAALDFVAKGDLVAFRVCEREQGENDLNFDGDVGTGDGPDDCIMHVLRLSTGAVENTERAADPCLLAGCDPFFEPYRVASTSVSFLTSEFIQSGQGVPLDTPLAVDCKPTGLPGQCDLSGDADNEDSMISVYNVLSGNAQLLPLGGGGANQEVPPFPTEIGDSGVLYIEVTELQIGEDIDGDGVITGARVIVLVGDADGDGTLDDSVNRNDSCVEVTNPAQADADGDLLGDDACDPAPTPSLPGDVMCDVDSNGQIDKVDAQIVFGDRGAAARTSDPRDPDGDGQITVLDVSACRALCTYPSCRVSAPQGGCGIGAEIALALAGLTLLRRRIR